jgi:hypothetical protein
MRYFKYFFWIILGLIFITLCIKIPFEGSYENLSNYDILPDTLGYIFITTGLAGLSEHSKAFSYARIFTVVLGLMSIVTYGNLSKHYFDLFAMQFTVIFGLLFTNCIIAFFILLLSGMRKLLHDNGVDGKVYSTTTCLVFAAVVNVIAALATLPEIKELFSSSANGVILLIASLASAVWIAVRLWKNAAAIENKFNEKAFKKNSLSN